MIMSVVCGFFFIFGIDLLISSYSLKDPFNFVMTFFASSFVILISLTLFISFIIKMIRVFRQVKKTNASASKDF